MSANSQDLVISALLEKIEVTQDVRNKKPGKRSHFFVRVYVANNKVAKSTREPHSEVINWKWDGGEKFLRHHQ
ncbi:hypothetical protein HYPSUDRAFT_49438 [Hypholoma sublateritium FD-334 SS-4]|uniref:C2 domain-containing protein n=1 Tax=Hypholoma sublateritium (strain FD-334 SS-4) TaxID=945553 RepID=A0A0D2N4J4_HYPSF|nr:hypothetical protein HYPSUDRAFT_49438 [Hypholoma sublateritium FD-334 SS-4]